jgi:putative redox protein
LEQHQQIGEAFMETATTTWKGEQRFVSIGKSGHQVTFDSESKTAPGPLEMVLMALGACTATDIVIILEKKRQQMKALEVMCSGERAAEAPRVWVKLDVLFRVRGKVEDAAMKHAMELTKEKYCSVAAMLKKTAEMTWHYEISD